jgi:hypothetical protein
MKDDMYAANHQGTGRAITCYCCCLSGEDLKALPASPMAKSYLIHEHPAMHIAIHIAK